MKDVIRRIKLQEHNILELPEEEMSEAVEEIVWKNYRDQIEIESPSFKTNNKWRLISKGWVGRIPISTDLEFILNPKVPLENIFGMLEYAFNLKNFKILGSSTDCASIDDFYERLAKILAMKILERGRKGFYRSYKPESGSLCYIRGRLDIRQAVFKPWEIKPKCHYEEHSFDIEDNRILIWTLQYILRGGLCTGNSLSYVRRAYQSLQGLADPTPFLPSDCIREFYNRLNQDYLSMHSLCRFFLENSGPSHQIGDRTMLPFLVDMASLYEKFVAEWLKANKSLLLPYTIKPLEKVVIGQGKKVRFEIDLVLYKDGKAHCVLDTKYKIPNEIKNPDFNQVVAYASAKNCHKAFLIYPGKLDVPWDVHLPGGDIRVRSLIFSLDKNIDQSGREFIEDLLKHI